MTDRKEKSSYITYVYDSLMNEIVKCGGQGELFFGDERAGFRFTASPSLKRKTAEVLSEVLGVGYKSDFLKNYLKVSLPKRERKFLCAALIAADYEGDRAYILRKLQKTNEYALDGIYSFRLTTLREKWLKIIGYIPAGFASGDLKKFCEFLVGESRNKIYLKDNTVFGENFTPLRRSLLMGEEDAETEIILSDAGFVYCLGEVETSLGDFLQKYFAERAIFS